jgi:hypothetical protein
MKENPLCLKQESLVHCFPLKSELVLKGILPPTYVFQRGDRPSLFQIGLFSRVEGSYVSLQRKPSLLEAAEYSTLLPGENFLVYGRNPSCDLGF